MISIALATYNGDRFLGEQLESYLKQTRLPDELVVCDDASSDGTMEILRDFRDKAPFPVHIKQNQSNRGTVASFADAISRCSGSYIFFSDHDDVWLPEKIDTIMSVFESDPDAGLVFCDAEVVDENLEPIGCCFWESVWFGKKSQAKVLNGKAFEVFLNHIIVAGMASAFRAEYNAIIFPMPDLSDGYDGWIALLIAAVSEIQVVNKQLVKYRVHGQNQVGIKTLSFKEQLKIGIQQIQNETFPNLLSYRKEILNRLTNPEVNSRYSIDESDINAVRKSIKHLELRMKLSKNKLMKAGQILSELMKGNYFRYSYGLKSVAQDLFLRK